MKAVGIISGGLDSTVLAYYLRRAVVTREIDLYLLSFDYGQRHVKELEMAAQTARDLRAVHEIVNLKNINRLISHSALTNPEAEIPEGHYAAANMATTVVPNRNAIMLSIAFGWAVNIGAEQVALGVHSGDHPIYPDCRDEFVRSFDLMERLATSGYASEEIQLVAPFVHKTKAEIVAKGEDLGVPFEKTWSCYAGGSIHCGRCGTCVERKEAFYISGVIDPTEYEDPSYEIEAFRG